MGFLKKLFESPYEREQREKREIEKGAQECLNKILFMLLDDNKKKCEQYSKLFPLGYKHVEQKFAYERTPKKEDSIARAVEDMAKYEMELLISSTEASRLINDCYSFSPRIFRVISARIKIDNLCKRVNKEKRDAWEVERERYERIYKSPYLGDLSVFSNMEKYDGLSYDYKTVEAPIVKELRLKKEEDERDAAAIRRREEARRAEAERNAAEARRKEEMAKEKMERQSRIGNVYSRQVNVANEQKEYAIKSIPSKSSKTTSQSSTHKSSVDSVTMTREKLLAKGVYEEARKNYLEAIESREWKQMRVAVLNRDNHTCQECGCKHDLRVHHKYYVMGHAIWDYPSSAFETLCEDCHREFHENNSVDVYDRIPRIGSQYKQIKLQKCPRCNGRGYLPEYSHVEHGVCFLCYGSGYRELFIGPRVVKVIESK